MEKKWSLPIPKEEWSGVEWSGVEWSGVEYIGVDTPIYRVFLLNRRQTQHLAPIQEEQVPIQMERRFFQFSQGKLTILINI